MFPFRLWGANILKLNGEDFPTDASSQVACVCVSSLKIGVPIAFWEPAYWVDVHTSPGCSPTAGGLEVPLPSVESQKRGFGRLIKVERPEVVYARYLLCRTRDVYVGSGSR